MVKEIFGDAVRVGKTLTVAANNRDGPLFLFGEIPEEIGIEGLFTSLFLPVVKLHFGVLRVV